MLCCRGQCASRCGKYELKIANNHRLLAFRCTSQLTTNNRSPQEEMGGDDDGMRRDCAVRCCCGRQDDRS